MKKPLKRLKKLKKTKIKIQWFAQPEAHDYPAAESYLSLIFQPNEAKNHVKELKAAKDVFRASKLSLLGVSNSHVAKNIKKIKNGEKLSPLLLVIDHILRVTIIADGYHRMCGCYHYDEDALIPCKIR